MMVHNRGSVLSLLAWQWRNTLIFAGAALAVVAMHEHWALEWTLPIVPVSVLGGAIGIFASFRTNSAYDRWWEGRKLWGRMINSSRMWSTQALAYLDDPDLAHRLVLRHVSYVHALRCLLRKQDPFSDGEFLAHLPDADLEALRAESNLTHALLHRQAEALRAALDAGHIDAFRLQSMDRTLMDLLNIQGGCERIKGTPLPRGYGFIVETLIQYYSLLLPFALVEDVGWFAVPLNLIVCLGFALISEAGRVLEDPFNLFWNALPLSELSRKIEVNLRQRLGHDDLPPMLTPDAKGILM